MALQDDLTQAAQAALSAGATAARAEGTNLANDFGNLLRPNYQAILVQITSITEALIAGTINTALAQANLQQQFERIGDLVMAEAELAAQAVQDIINAVLDALKAGINTATTRAIGIPLF